MNVFKLTGRAITSPFRALYRAFDMRDVFLFLGMTMLGYGLYLHWGLWLTLMVCGVLLMVIGYLMQGSKRQ